MPDLTAPVPRELAPENRPRKTGQARSIDAQAVKTAKDRADDLYKDGRSIQAMALLVLLK